ncbi:MAG: hypothetical protein ACYS0D_10030 [Planctomycetota bacterium]|jgi:hypothetical protein
MPDINEDDSLEATEEQLSTLRGLGVAESDLDNLSFADAEEWIAELEAMKEDAGQFGRD